MTTHVAAHGAHPLHPARDPSRPSKRALVALLALAGAAVALRLAAYQLGWTGPPWEPLFGDGSERVLESAFSRSLPFPDAGAGALAYVAEAVLVALGGRQRWNKNRWLVFAYGAIAAGMALGSAGLVLMQAFVVRAFCTLCLVSAAISFALALPAWTETRAAWKARKKR